MVRKTWLFLMLSSAALTAAGILLGDAEKVLGKSIRICLECIGIG
ncbi:MAG: CD1871A family CXXC motif-containing protein [Bacillota bacterium]